MLEKLKKYEKKNHEVKVEYLGLCKKMDDRSNRNQNMQRNALRHVTVF